MTMKEQGVIMAVLVLLAVALLAVLILFPPRANAALRLSVPSGITAKCDPTARVFTWVKGGYFDWVKVKCS